MRRLSFIQLSQIIQNHANVILHPRVVRTQIDGLSKRREGLFPPAVAFQRVPQIKKKFRNIRPQRYGAPIGGRRFLPSGLHRPDCPEINQRAHMIGGNLDRALVSGDRFVQPARVAQLIGGVEQACGFLVHNCFFRASCSSSPAICLIGVFQSPSLGWRNSFAVGYQGQLLPSSSHRQSGRLKRSTQVGLPSAPARCAAALSIVTTKSRFAISAAVSAKSEISEVPSKISISAGAFLACAAASPNCRLTKITPRTSPSGKSSSNGTLLRGSGLGRPFQTSPTFNRFSFPSLSAHLSARPGLNQRYGTLVGIVSI